MKKSTASITLAAVAGFSVLTASPAMAAPFQNCEEARNAGQVNIPATSPLYNPNSDRDNDGIACEEGDPASVTPAVGTPVPAPAPAPAPGQVTQMPVGGAATGVAQTPENNQAPIAVGAGLILVAVAGGSFMVRRRATQA